MCMHYVCRSHQVHSEEVGLPSQAVHLYNVVTEEWSQGRGRGLSAVLNSSSCCSQHKTQACKQGNSHVFSFLCFTSCQMKLQVRIVAVEQMVHASSCSCSALNTYRCPTFLPFHFFVSCQDQCGNVADRTRGFTIPCTSD